MQISHCHFLKGQNRGFTARSQSIKRDSLIKRVFSDPTITGIIRFLIVVLRTGAHLNILNYIYIT